MSLDEILDREEGYHLVAERLWIVNPTTLKLRASDTTY
jgi:hypothetical protein